MSASTTLLKKAKQARKNNSDTFADYLLELRKSDAHKAAGYTAERPFYKTQFGIADRALSDWTHAGRVRAALKADGIDLKKLDDAGVTAYSGIPMDKVNEVKSNLDSGMTLKEALLTAANAGLAAFEKPEQAFNEVLGESLPPAFEALQLAISTLAFNTALETLKDGQAVLMECYEALGLVLEATDRDISLADGLEIALNTDE